MTKPKPKPDTKKRLNKNKPSNTADLIAFFRAIESFKPEGQRICYDPFAIDFASLKFAFMVKSRVLRKSIPPVFDKIVPGQFSYIAARTRYIDDYLKECINSGTKQLVILGAGYDSRAYRLKDLLGNIKVFEVDHETIQQIKIHKVKNRFGSLPTNVSYIGMDFTKDNLNKLVESGYDKNLKTLFIWEGVAMYLSKEDVDETLAFVSSNSAEGSSIIFDYIFRSAMDKANKIEGAKVASGFLSLIGEPYTFGIEKGQIESFLCKRGFKNVRNVDNKYLKDIYFEGENKKRKIKSYSNIVHATVAIGV